MPDEYNSPFTGDLWAGVQPCIGTIAAVAHWLNTKSPHAPSPVDVDEAIVKILDASAVICGLPVIEKFGDTGRRISDAYWQAKHARGLLCPHLDAVFLANHSNWGWYLNYAKDHDTNVTGGYRIVLTVPAWIRASRLAYLAAGLIIQVSSGAEDTARREARYTIAGVQAELALGGIENSAVAPVERNWRFICVAGRQPVPGVDDDLVAAFEAAIMIGDGEFVRALVK